MENNTEGGLSKNFAVQQPHPWVYKSHYIKEIPTYLFIAALVTGTRIIVSQDVISR